LCYEGGRKTVVTWRKLEKKLVLLDDGLHLYGIPLSKTQFEAQHKHIWLDAIKQTYWTVGTCDD